MISALGDCVPVLQQVKHESVPQVMLDAFEKEISDTLHEVREYYLHYMQPKLSGIFAAIVSLVFTSDASTNASVSSLF